MNTMYIGRGMMDLKGTVAVVTGASSGIGAAVVRAFAGRGASVVLAARDRNGMEEVVDSCPRGTESLVIPTDLRDESQVVRLVDQTIERFGRLDTLVNNAGFGIFKPLSELTCEQFDNIIDVNLRGAFLAMKYALPHMYERRDGTVVTVSSIAGKHGFANGSAYCASKFGLMGLMECAFHEARRFNVRVVTVTPGSVDTPFFDEAHTTPPNRELILQPEDVADTVLMAITLPRRALVRELDIRPTNPSR